MNYYTPITIFNRYRDTATRTIKYTPTILKKCLWKGTEKLNLVAGGTQIAEEASVIIYLDNLSVGKSYLPPKQWINNPEIENFWTVQRDDIIIKGAVLDDFTNQAEMESTHDCMLKIVHIDVNFLGNPRNRHIRVGGV